MKVSQRYYVGREIERDHAQEERGKKFFSEENRIYKGQYS